MAGLSVESWPYPPSPLRDYQNRYMRMADVLMNEAEVPGQTRLDGDEIESAYLSWIADMPWSRGKGL